MIDRPVPAVAQSIGFDFPHIALKEEGMGCTVSCLRLNDVLKRGLFE